VYVAPVLNSNPSIAYANCLALSQAFRDTYTVPGLRIGSGFIVPNHLTVKLGFGSTGFAYTMKWGAAIYYGFEIHVPIMTAGS
jgi:hypothetical protein